MLLTLLFALLSPALAVGLYFWLFPAASPLWLIAVTVGVFLLLCLLYLVFLVISSMLLGKKPPERYSRYARAVIVLTVDWVLCMLRVRVKVKGKDMLPKEPFVLISNHRSAMDALAVLHAFPRRELSFIAKASVLRWRVVGPYMSKGGFLGIERDMPLQALRVVTRAAKLVKTGMSFGIFPEGTRTKDGRVGDFKEGAFITAKKASCPIVIITTEGTESIFRRLFPKVTVTVRAVLDAHEVDTHTHTELSSICRSTICKALGEEF